MNTQNRIGRFDQVKILTTKNVKYLSSPSGSKTSPDGIWSVVAAVDNDLLLAQKSTIVRIPSSDVLRILAYDLEAVIKNLGRLSGGKK